MSTIKYQLKSRIQPTLAPLTAAVGMALSATTLQAAVITVDTLADGSLPGQCTLRDALIAANTDTATAACAAGSGADEVLFQSGLNGTITLTGGSLPILSEVTISGPGANLVTISGNNTDRVFYIQNSAGAVIDGLRLSNGYTNQVNGGAAVGVSSSMLTLSNCEIADNYSGPVAYGGAVTAYVSDLTIDQCEMTGNIVVGGAVRGSSYAFGGAVLSASSQLIISDSSFSDNQAGTYGGALALFNTLATVSSSTFSANQAPFGGAISVGDGSYAFIDASLISLNEAAAGGGLIVGSLSSADLYQVDIYANNADQQGGGIQVGVGYAAPGPVSAPSRSESLFGGTLTFSLIGPGNLEMMDSTVDANLASSYGGGLAAKYDSNVSLVSSIISNNIAQPPLPLEQDASGTSGAPANSGAGGGLIARDSSYLVAENVSLSGNYASYAGGGALADSYAELVVYNSTVNGNAALIGGGLTAGFIDTTVPIIRGNGLDTSARGGGGYNGAVAAINSTVTNNLANGGGGIAAIYGGFAVTKYSDIISNYAYFMGGGVMAYDGYFLSDGSSFSNNAGVEGGGIVARGGYSAAIIGQSSITGNDAQYGGGLDLRGGQSDVKYSTVADNTANVAGGVVALGTLANPVTIVNSTVTGNTAGQVGGIYVSGAELDFLTISHNTASGVPAPLASGLLSRGLAENPGGAYLSTSSGDVLVTNSIFANNVSPGYTVDLTVNASYGTVSLDYSLVWAPGTGLPAGTGNVIGVDPQLGPLADNGGPTLTRALPETSPAVDTGNPATTVSYDQRGEPYPRVFGGRADMGAFEFIIDGIFSDRFEQP